MAKKKVKNLPIIFCALGTNGKRVTDKKLLLKLAEYISKYNKKRAATSKKKSN